MISSVHDNVSIQGTIQANSKPISYKQGALIRAQIQDIDGNAILIKLSSGQTLSARVEGHWLFEAGAWVDFEVLEWASNIAILKPLNTSAPTQTDLISKYMDRLGLARTPENEAMLCFMLLEGIPLDQDNVSFFMKKQFRLSLGIRMLMELAMQEGLSDNVKKLDGSFPRMETLVEFLKDLPDNIEKIHHELIDLGEKLMDKDKNREMRRLVGSLFRGMLIQMSDNHHFQMVQLPIKINGRLTDSEMWVDRESDVIYLETDLPHLGTAGCLLEGWRSKANLTFYCDEAWHSIIRQNIGGLRQALKDIGIRVGRMDVCSREQYVLRNFLGRYKNEHDGIDVKV